ncbi:helix-turn-helix transcriptional regulator [Clostridium botulinum]|nr:helix-turn-helix transcriptional regulator [Clostridium botulinum]
MNIGDNIRKYRELSKLTRVQLGNALGKSESTIQKWESGSVDVTISVLERIASVTGVSVQKLIIGENLVQVKKTINNEIVVFSHVNGRTESIMCEEYEITSIGNTAYVKAISYGEVRHIIPFNRVKQINLDI